MSRQGGNGPAYDEWMLAFRRCSNLGRRKGACPVERTAQHRGHDYDPKLLHHTEIDALYDAAPTHHDTDPDERVRRLVAHAERIRAHETWPEDLNATLGHISHNSEMDQTLSALDPDTPEFAAELERFRTTSRLFRGSKWEAEWRKRRAAEKLRLKEESLAKRRHMERARRAANAHEERCIEALGWGGTKAERDRARTRQRKPHRGQPKKLEQVDGRWVVLLDPERRSFATKSIAYEASKHCQAMQRDGHQPSAAVMASLAERDTKAVARKERR